uniref:CID domain-containing protein n=1 Tax=Chenopodium quinoa TaxID=63459 RepID=A0A803MXZ7_CHEQI
MFNSSQKEKCVSFLFLANDILQNSRRKGNEFVNEFWKVLPAALKLVYDNGDESGKKAANRLVDIWEERKVFGSRVQSLKEELAANQIKDPAPQPVSNGKSPNPIKIVKKDAQSLRIKLAVGGFPEKIVSAFHCLHDECSNEESMLVNCNATVNSVERILKEIEATTSQGIQPGTGMTDEMEEQEHALKQCVGQLEGAEAIRVTLVSLLKEAVQEQSYHKGTVLLSGLPKSRIGHDFCHHQCPRKVYGPMIPLPNSFNLSGIAAADSTASIT